MLFMSSATKQRIKPIISLLLLSSLVGCQATQRQGATTGEMETNSTTKGAAIGSLSGAAIGLLSGDNSKERKKRALIGATAGGLIGGGVGYSLDKQEEALRQELLDSGVQVKRVGENELVLVMENGIGFRSGEYLLEPTVYNSLNGVARILVEYPDSYLQIKGYTDSTGNDTFNQQLSEKRADSVKAYLVNQKVKGARISASGLGERYPICDNATADGRACNRRVEISIQAI